MNSRVAKRDLDTDALPPDLPGVVYVDRQYEKKLLRDMLAEAVVNTVRLQKTESQA